MALKKKTAEKIYSHPQRGKRKCHATLDKWRVIYRHSTYANGRFKHSESSLCTCLSCRMQWRTKADYVALVADASPKERLAVVKGD